MGKTRDQYKREKALSDLYQHSNENISFTQFKKNLGIKKGRPKKDKKHKKRR